MSGDPVHTLFLSDGGQREEAVAACIAEFIAAARRTLEIAIYDLRLQGAAAEAIRTSVRDAHARGVHVRVVFNQDHPAREPDPPPPAVDWDLLHQLDVPFKPISGVPDLMHHKYVVRDEKAVLTGSANWTNDSWTREENVIVWLESSELAGWYRRDFEDLWEKRNVAASGHFTVPWIEVSSRVPARAFFSPGRGAKLAHEVAHRIGAARRRLWILSPVITSGPILGTLAEVVARRPALVSGTYDATQMDEVRRQWGENPAASWKLQAWSTIDSAIAFGRKRSTPWSSGGVHDFMHAKFVVADDTVLVGSYNLSHSGEENAENVLEIEDAALADRFAAFAGQVTSRYGGTAQKG